MDRTLLRVNPLVGHEGAEIHGLTLVDVTIDCRKGVLRLRSGLAALRLVRCRIARGTVLGGADAGALSAEGCEFEGGRLAGGGPYEGCRLLAATRGLARLDDCLIRGTIDAYSGHVACLFRRCTFVQVHANLQSNLERQSGVRLEDCRFDVVDNPPPPRRLQAINPAWRD